MDINLAFGRVFRKLREDRRLSQLAVEADYGISAKYQSDIENGKRNVSLKFIEKTANTFGIRFYELIEMVERESMKMPTL